MRTRALLVALALALPLAGCESFDFGTTRHATLTYSDDARLAYNEALKSFQAREWEDAKALFTELKKLFPYTRYARLAELRLADIAFEQEKFADSITNFREYISSHKNDPEIEYARYKVTRALFRDIDDTIFLPPQEERDQATAAEAYREIRGFLRDYPRSPHLKEERYMFDVVTGRLVRHELYVARYYLRHDNFPAAVARIDYAIKAYPASTLEAEALVLKGETLMKMKKLDDARAVLEAVRKDYGGPFAVPAGKFLDEIAEKERALGVRPKPEAPKPASDPAKAGPVPAEPGL